MSCNDYVVSLKNISKRYEIYDRPIDRLKQLLFPNIQTFFRRPKKQYFREFWALNNISFDVTRGETIGILGVNGAGKSTLLQTLAGVLNPSNGSVELNGRLVALLELGAGFNSEFTGRENLFIYGSLLGLSSEEIFDRLDAIVEFAEIGDFFDLPVKTYSSGMFARLAFSIAINVNPDVLIVDETLSVGDARFQQKCIRKIDELKQSGCTIIFVSHDVQIVKKICETAILINSGKLIACGNVQDVSNKYFELLNFNESEFTQRSKEPDTQAASIDDLLKVSHFLKLGDQAVTITHCGFFAQNGRRSERFSPGERVTLKVLFDANEALSNLFIGFMFKDEKGIDIFGCNSLANGHSYDVAKNGEYLYKLEFQLPNITNRKYLIDLAISSGSWAEHVHRCWIHDAMILEISSLDNRYHSHTYLALDENQISNEILVKIDG